MPAAGDAVRLVVEKPAAGGRMIARIDGQIVLVGGAIPGETVMARVDRVAKGVVYAETVQVAEASHDRRFAGPDPLCGGCLYAHISYPRQLEIKSQIIGDAFGRIGRLTLPSPVHVAASPESGYRMRARLHVRGARVGFFREGTHDVCDVRQTGQLLPATCDVLDRFAAALDTQGATIVRELELSENVDASDRVLSLDGWASLSAETRSRLAGIEDLSGAGPDASVVDRIALNGADPVVLRRNVRSFFQGNRFLLGDLVRHVVGLVPENGTLLDLYAGSGLFSVAAAAARHARVTAVEGDRFAAHDLHENAAPYADLRVHHQPVEAFLEQRQPPPSAIVVDPPRTGMTRAALDGVVGLKAGLVIYVSCDVATLARDARRLVDAGYAIARADAFDLFPNTPHVETVAVFTAS
jgi:23S rRNA (uracil1939-C5)-methyltransferase